MKILFIVISMLAISPLAWSWGDLGHSAVGDIAEQNLTEKGKMLVQSILGLEPLAVAATWPDHVRDDNRFKEFASYHFWDMPEGVTSYAQISESQREERDAQTIISQVPKLLVSSRLGKKHKMVLMRYLVHVVGDVHQPFHLGNPSDRGGNLCEVKIKGQKDILKLHSVWDSQIIDTMKPEGNKGFYYPQLVKMILKEVPAPKEITGTPLEWYDETRKLLAAAYPDEGKEGVKPEDRAYCKRVDPKNPNAVVDGKFDATQIPTLSDQYMANSVSVVKKQILLAGLRLAHILNKAGEDYAVYDYIDEKKLIQDTLIKNKTSERTPQSKSKK